MKDTFSTHQVLSNKEAYDSIPEQFLSQQKMATPFRLKQYFSVKQQNLLECFEQQSLFTNVSPVTIGLQYY